MAAVDFNDGVAVFIDGQCDCQCHGCGFRFFGSSRSGIKGGEIRGRAKSSGLSFAACAKSITKSSQGFVMRVSYRTVAGALRELSGEIQLSPVRVVDDVAAIPMQDRYFLPRDRRGGMRRTKQDISKFHRFVKECFLPVRSERALRVRAI